MGNAGKNEKEKIIEMSGKMAELLKMGYKVNIYPVKDGIKITSHKEKTVK